MICQKKRKNIMDVNFEYYKIFYYVAKYHNFTKAAQALNNSQPNITRAMNCLEQQLNTTLFIRTNRGVQLTPEGERLYTHVLGAMEQFQAFPRKCSHWRQLNCPEYFSVRQIKKLPYDLSGNPAEAL